MSDYRDHRKEHPGPLSQKSFQFWRSNGGKDLDGFVWKDSGKKINKKQKKKKKQPQKTTKTNKNL